VLAPGTKKSRPPLTIFLQDREIVQGTLLYGFMAFNINFAKLLEELA
jgi:hypothetical protein